MLIVAHVLRGLLGVFLLYIFTRLIWGAIQDPKFRKQFLKTSSSAPPTTTFNTALWVVLFIFYILLILFTFDAVRGVFSALS